MKIKNRKNVLVRALITAGNPQRFTFPINNVSFVPDELIVRSGMLSDSNNGYPYYVVSNLVDNNVLLTVQDARFLNSSTYYHDMNKPVNGVFSFDIVLNTTNTVQNAIAGTDVMFMLEFVEYEKDK